MTQFITHFVKFVDEVTAKAALTPYWAASAINWDWDRSIVDGPIPVVTDTNTFTQDEFGNQVEITKPVPGYFLNIALPELDVSLPGLTGAGYGPAENFVLVYGTNPVTPQRVFA